nr:MFS transporter [Caloramator mitchellensis]
MLKAFKPYIGLPRGVYILFFARIINAMGNFVFPLLTMYLTDKLGLSSKTAGQFVSLAAMSYFPGAIIGGKLSDHIGRKKVLITSQLLAGLLFLPCAFLEKSMLIPWLLILAGVMNGAAQPASSALLTDITTKENRKQSFSLLYLGINIGFSVGPLIAGFLYKNYIQWVFLGNTISIIVATFLVAHFVEDKKAEINNEDEELLADEDSNTFRELLKRKQLLVFGVISIAFSFAYSQGNFATTMQLKEGFGQEASKYVGLLNSVNGLTVIILTTVIIHITKKNKAIFNIFLAGIFFAVGFGMLYFVRSAHFYILSTIIWTIGEILSATNSGVYIANHSPTNYRARFSALMNIISGFGHGIGPYLMGTFIGIYGVRMVWPLVFGITSIATLLMFLLYKNERSE